MTESAVQEAEWKAAFDGVHRAVIGTPEQLAELERDLLTLAVESRRGEEIAKVAQTAGQMGVARQDLVQFTVAAVALATTTNLTPVGAAEGLGALVAIMGVTPAEAWRVSAALVAAGRSYNVPESDILNMALRLASAGRLAGFAVVPLIVLAATLVSFGVDIEMGGASAACRKLLDVHMAASAAVEEPAEDET